MQINSQEHEEIIADFEKQFCGLRIDKEPRELWPKQNIYQNGEANALFLAFRAGYATARCVYLQEGSTC